MRFSRIGEHAWAIQEADRAVDLLRPVAGRYPAAMARALAVRAACLHVRGRTAEAARDVDEALAYRDRATDPADATDLAVVASHLDLAGRTDEALALTGRLLSGGTPPARPLLFRHCALLLRHGRADEAVPLLRGVHEAAHPWSHTRYRAGVMLFEALAAAGRTAELAEHARRELPNVAASARGNAAGRRIYLEVLELLHRHHALPDHRPPLDVTIAKQRRILLRGQRRRWILAAAFAVLTGDRRRIPPRPGATPPAELARAAARDRVTRVEARLERLNASDDARALSIAWGELAEARWDAGGQRSAALQAQRAALEQTRRWAAEHPADARTALVTHLRRFAEIAGAIGLRTDAEAAETEADELADSA
ncbi:hypothetical protein Val02_09110 [Virgisporangium aliadipatigenens]|uniref:Tetratricopeptide repeat protein n=2 Tax=Virgisporangium aliadipatigenens TaxID=741659 RepID=A0A8J3YHD4_9ACTN|nr:hypothetical protein Val02_09110 [Virgisporangium aliadipatigenens]